MKFLRKLFGLKTAASPVRGRDRDFDLKGLERIIQYQFKDPALARQAMTHRSYLHATPGRTGESNERMEFLGDSVVGLVVNDYLYRKFPKLREGELTKMKSLLVSRVILSRAANQLGLGTCILLSDAETGSGGRNRASILADTLEGIIGAMYLDGGLEPARRLTQRLLLKEVHAILSDANLANYKSMLQEYVQGEFKTHPQYRISSEYGPDHQKMFTVEVVVGGKTFGRGHGSNKKEAEQEAARDALFHFEKLVRPDKERAQEEGRRRRRRGGRGRRGGRDRDEGAATHGGEPGARQISGERSGSGERHGSRERHGGRERRGSGERGGSHAPAGARERHGSDDYGAPREPAGLDAAAGPTGPEGDEAAAAPISQATPTERREEDRGPRRYGRRRSERKGRMRLKGEGGPAPGTDRGSEPEGSGSPYATAPLQIEP